MIKKIIIARSYGFCMGVKRAINIAEETAEKATDKVTILNEIVHNEAVVEKFRNDGVGQALSLNEVDEGTLIISAHGIAPAVIEEAENKGLNVIDATCPLVTRIYDIIQKVVKNDYYIIHYGDPNHDETQGVVGYAPERITVVEDISKFESMPDWKDRKLAMTIQTTSSMEEADNAKKVAMQKWSHLEVFDTICNATSQRQSAIVDLANDVDMILVVGSTTSANSKRLASIANALCGHGVLISNADEVKEDWFARAENIGVSAGASTPEFLVKAVIERLQEIAGGKAEVTQQERRKKKRQQTVEPVTN